ncbi:hypothetical protein Hanom_Chr03g00216071 [Helianthus anomalus]
MAVRGRVTASHDPWLVNIGVTVWSAKRVPVGRRLASWAVLARVCDMAHCDRVGGGDGGLGLSGMSFSGSSSEDDAVVTGLALRDMVCM